MKAMNSVRLTKKKSDFKSYIVPLDNFHERAVDVPEEPKEDKIEPLLLPDELVVAEAKNVLKFASLQTQKVILGTLYVTNFKITFVTSSLPVDAKEMDLHSACLHSDFLGLHDVCLTQIDSIYCLLEMDGSKKKKVTCSTPLPSKIKGLQIVLKSFRIINFGFGLTHAKEDLKLTKALLVHRFPKRIDLFYLALDTPPPPSVLHFRFCTVWEVELQRTKCSSWRICKHNESHKAFPSLPSSFVVPHCITDSELATAAHHFQGNRPLVWCWGTPRGAALVRMAQLSPNISSNTDVENNLMKMIHKCHPQKIQPTIVDLDQELPPLKAIQGAFLKLRDLHTPDSASSYNDSERNYLSRWQCSGWLAHVRACLSVAQVAASALVGGNSSVVLQECEGRDLSCVISSLVQVLADPFPRTFRGFHNLIQKEWIALGHPFCLRLGHLKPYSDEVCPLWLLFLNCMHQLSLDFPSAFEYSSAYLLALWHASHFSLHSTFMFDSVKDKMYGLVTLKEESRSKEAYLWPVWAWWGRGEGLRSTLQNQCLVARKGTIHRRQEKYKKRASLIGSSSSSASLGSADEKRSIPLGQERREILAEERHLEDEGKTLKRQREVRERARESFINVLYVQTLLESILAPECLSRLSDPLASVHTNWNRLNCLLGRGEDPLPYDPSLPLPSLDMSAVLQIPTHGRVTPWTECFGMWVCDPSYTPSSHPSTDDARAERMRPAVEPCQSPLSQHWKVVHNIFSTLEQVYKEATQNFSNGDTS